MFSQSNSGSCWFSGLCGGRRRRQRWQQATGRDVASPIQPKTARFYGVQPLFAEPSPGPASRPMSTLSECGTDTVERNTESITWPAESATAYSESGRSTPRMGGEKLERWLGENLRTIPEDERYASAEGHEQRPRTYLLSIGSPATTSGGPSVEGEEFELIVQGTSDMSVVGGGEWESSAESTYARPQTSYTTQTGQTSYTATFLLDDPYSSSHEAIQQFLAAMQGRQSIDCSSMASEYTDGTSWVFRPLRPAPSPSQPQGFLDFLSSSGSRARSNSTKSREQLNEGSTELAFYSGPTSEYGERIVLRRMHSSSTFRSRFGSKRGDRNSKLSAGTANTGYPAENSNSNPPMPSAHIPRRAVSIRAVRRRLLDPQTSGNQPGSTLFTPLTREQACQCSSLKPETRVPVEPAASAASRVQHWVSGQQQQYQDGPSELLVSFTSVYPIVRSTKRGSGSHTVGDGASSIWGSVQGDDYSSLAPRQVRGHEGNCPCFDYTPVPVYQEVDPNPNPLSGR